MLFRVRAIVFDLDGVLVDSMPAIRSVWADWARVHGIGVELLLADIHLTADELVRKFAPHLDPAAEAQATALAQLRIETGITALEGSETLIAQLPAGSWAVVTSGRRELALRHFEIGRLPVPEVLITAEDTPRGKPDPAGYLLAAERLGLSPSACLAIEDSLAGVTAARRAGMTVLAVPNTHAASSLSEADWIIGSLRSLRVTRTDDGASLEVAV